MRKKVGIWLIGVHGGLATTAIFGARAIARNLTPISGMITEVGMFQKLDLLSLSEVVFGGYDIRKTSVFQSAYEIYKKNGTLDYELLLKIKDDLFEVDKEILSGTTLNCGKTIEGLATEHIDNNKKTLREWIATIKSDLLRFKERKDLSNVIVVNVASTEPILSLDERHEHLHKFENLLDKNESSLVRASTLYSYAAIDLGFPYINFTPSNTALIPAIQELAEKKCVPFMGSDGKTGETMLKSAIAPMFKYRNLTVMSWQGYNILGDRDGMVLSDEDSKAAKVSKKDKALRNILGYPLHTHVGIDYVPSLDDWKTAWDFIHFKGFLGVKMAMQFTWQGCDSILAAPLILDMARLADFALRKSESGPMKHLACFFKDPVGVNNHNLHNQFHMLLQYVKEHTKIQGDEKEDVKKKEGQRMFRVK